MSMLTAPRRKQKWTLNSRGQHWSEDSNKFGQKMLEKMGWTNGKGLGAQEQGAVDHIKVKIKNDFSGIGFDKYQDNNWCEQQIGFDNILQDLQKEQSVNSENLKNKNEALSGKSLEEKSKRSTKRVHYRKFIRGKDVNKYSTKDLANIFGKKDLNERYVKEENVENVENTNVNEIYDSIGTKSTSGGIVTIQGGNMNAYFKSKSLNSVQKNNIDNTSDNESDTLNNAGFSSTIKSKSKFYINNSTNSPTNADSESESERYVGFGFSKSKKVSNLNYVFDNPCLDLNILDDNSTIKVKTEIIDKCSKKVAPKKRKSESLCINAYKSSDCSNAIAKKRKSDFRNENKGLDLQPYDHEVPSKEDPNNSISNEDKNMIVALELSNREMQKKSKKIKRKSLSTENENDFLDMGHEATLNKLKENECKLLSSGYDNLGLDLRFSDRSIPKKPKRNKTKLLSSVNKNIELEDKTSKSNQNSNLGLNVTGSPNSKTPNIRIIKTEVISPGYTNLELKKLSLNSIVQIKNNEVKLEQLSNAYENVGLDLDYPDKMSQQIKKIDKDCEKYTKILPNIQNNSISDFEILNKSTPIKSKKSKKSKILYSGFENPALDLEILEIKKEGEHEDNKTFSNVHNILGLNSNQTENEVHSVSNFEVSRISCGLENSALDLSDENVKKRRVTFNDQVEYSSDIFKKKKKKRKLDKYEVVNEKKLKKINKTIEPATFINEALDVQVINVEEMDNDLNEKKSKKCKSKKERRISSLDTIEEIAEEEMFDENLIITTGKVKEDKQNIEDIKEIAKENSPQKKDKGKKKKDIKIELTKANRNINDLETENFSFEEEKITKNINKKDKRIKISLDEDNVELTELSSENIQETQTNVENETEIYKEDNIETDTIVKYNKVHLNYQKLKKSKLMIKSFFQKNPTLMFNGSNINEIKGYGCYD